MSNVISFEDAKNRKLAKSAREESQQKPYRDTPSTTEVSFLKKATKFKFLGMRQPAVFVKVNTSTMPPYFPPDAPPPMAA